MAPFYEYKALNNSGKSVRGVIEADSQKTARVRLKSQQLIVTEINEKNTQTTPSSLFTVSFSRIGIKDITLMTTQLASLVKANIPLVEALSALIDQTDNQKLRLIISQVRQSVNEGSSLAKAMASYPSTFDNIYVSMIETGESSGNLSFVLIKLAELKEAQLRLRSKLITAMTYPTLMFLVSSMLMIGIFAFMLPKLTQIFQGSKKKLPWITEFFMQISNVIVNWWLFIFGFIVVIFMLFLRYIRSPSGKEKWDTIKMRLPFLGEVVRLVAVTRFANTMSTLLSSGVSILTSLQIAKNIVDNVPISKAIASARENITEGQSIAEPLKKSGQFPPMMIHMIAVGEKTGDLPEMLQSVAKTYEEQVNASVSSLTSLLEPAMIVFMGGIISLIVISVFLPLMDLMNISQR